MNENSSTRVRWGRRMVLPLVGAVIVAAVVLAVVLGLQGGKRDSASTSAATRPATASATESASPPASASASAEPSAGRSTGSAAASPPPSTSPLSPELAPVAPDKTVKTETADVQITKVEHVAGKATGAGEVDGPALRFTVVVKNASNEPLNAGLIAVNAYYGAALTPANPFEQPGGRAFQGTVKPGDTVTAVLLFAVPKAHQDDVTVTVDYEPGKPVAVFRGSFS